MYLTIRDYLKCCQTTSTTSNLNLSTFSYITILLDNGYHPKQLEELKKIYPAIMTKIKFQLSPKPSITQKTKEGKTGCVPVKVRWVIERTNSWMERCKSLVKNFERTLDHATAKLNLCFVRLMLKRLATC